MSRVARMLICYYSRTGHTKRMAEVVAAAAGQTDRLQVELKSVEEVEVKSLLDFDAIVLGSPTYYGSMAAELKRLIDESVAFHGQLIGKVGGAFASSANTGGGNETTIMDILKALLIHGMVVQGTPTGDHYGPVAVGKVDARAEAECEKYGKYVGELTMSLHAR